ncbi:MAG TPA: hypothetical protein VGS12_07415 [Caulobacteraceae bacterium]|nr:hypothetical protein [Caulobacteraceae bacterium]
MSVARGEVTSVLALANSHRLYNHYIAKLLPLAWLAPDLVEAILDGRQPPTMTLSALTAKALPEDWVEQRRLFEGYATA